MTGENGRTVDNLLCLCVLGAEIHIWSRVLAEDVEDASLVHLDDGDTLRRLLPLLLAEDVRVALAQVGVDKERACRAAEVFGAEMERVEERGGRGRRRVIPPLCRPRRLAPAHIQGEHRANVQRKAPTRKLHRVLNE